jgi:transcriptional regulator with XRE-family HTH domain
MTINYPNILKEVLAELPSRKGEIIEQRYGINSGIPLTLQAIGDELNITRERVRQIENDALGWIKENKINKLESLFRCFLDYFEQHGGLREESRLLKELGENKFQNHVFLILTLGNDFKKFKETEEFYPFWATRPDSPRKARSVLQQLIDAFKKVHSPMSLEKAGEKIAININPTILVSYIDISKFIFQSPFGMYGLIDWPEINPRGLKDRAYLVLKENQRPLHFIEITQKIEELPNFSKKVLPESVHNELIRNERFVLVGRGIYALREWGYQPGTVKDIMIEILKQAKRPLPKEIMVQRVLEQREVKESTVVLNLQDKNVFRHDNKGRFFLI